MPDIIIRCAVAGDAAELLEIYAPYVENTAITFEYEVPSTEEFCRRMERIMEKYPYLVAQENGRILGYAYTSAFHPRKAYGWSAETTIYIRQGEQKKGLGKRLYRALEDISRAQNIQNLNACIGYPEKEDEYLTKNSAGFHEHMGYSVVGEFHKSGYKFGRWYNMIWMEKLIGEHEERVKAVIPFPSIPEDVLAELGIRRTAEQMQKSEDVLSRAEA